jgi:catechol 2,3-dioxygenase-like lactoylglutathione lyase family enzyme
MIHHVSVDVGELERSARFYDSVLGALGWRRHVDNDKEVAWGIVRPVFYARAGNPNGSGGHVCVSASGIPAVKGAWEGGVRSGGTDDGAPAARPEYGGSYYSAYLRDPDGNRIEIAVQSN